MPEVALTAGTIEYEDVGGPGPVLVLLHGLLMDGSLWRHVVADLRVDHRCVVPTLPLGGHRRPMRRSADLSGPGQARLLAELMHRLDLREVTLVGCDWGGAQLLAADGPNDRIARLVLTSQEAFDNVPPGLPGRAVWLAARVPGGLNASLQPLRIRALRRAPMTFGWMTKRPVPDQIMDGWLHPALHNRHIRRDLRKYLRSTRTDVYEGAARRLGSFNRPALVVWATDDRVMPIEHGRRLATTLPHARFIEVPDSGTLIPEDQPALLASAIRAFLRDTAVAPPH
jgi:pimeloyl-ACP methyl ester carboxylesterase